MQPVNHATMRDKTQEEAPYSLRLLVDFCFLLTLFLKWSVKERKLVHLAQEDPGERRERERDHDRQR